MPSINPQEELCRHQKAVKLTDVLWEAGANSIAVHNLNQSDWVIVAQLAEVRPPSADTQRLCTTLVRAREMVRERLACAKTPHRSFVNQKGSKRA